MSDSHNKIALDAKAAGLIVEHWKRDVQHKIVDKRDRDSTTRLIEYLLNRLCNAAEMTAPPVYVVETIRPVPVSRSEVVADVYANKITGEMMCAIEGIDGDIAFAVGDEDMIKMFEADKAYGEKCLATFGQDDDMALLRRNLYNQDTAARDRYYKVFDLIDEALEEINA